MKNQDVDDFRTAAVLTIKNAGDMSDEGRREIAAWLRRQADQLVRYGADYSEGRFTARYLYKDEKTENHGAEQKVDV